MEPDAHVTAAKLVYDNSVDGYVDFVGTRISAATEAPLDRSVLSAFVELVGAEPMGPVADLGCGPGRVAALLADSGLDVVGVDVSEGMLDAARRAHPAIAFQLGQLDRLPFADAELGGAVCWYSIIYTPQERLGEVFSELRRVLASGSHALLAFQAGVGEVVVRENAHGTPFPLASVRHDVEHVARELRAAGFGVRATVVREAELDHETTRQAFVLARAE